MYVMFLHVPHMYMWVHVVCMYSWIAHPTDFRCPALKFEPRTLCLNDLRAVLASSRQMQMADLICYMKLRKKLGYVLLYFFPLVE